MKLFSLFLLTTTFLLSCNRHAALSLNNNTSNQIIGIQPLDNYTAEQIDTVIKNISEFYNKKVIVLSPIDIPKSYFNGLIKQYNADSIILRLNKLCNDSLVEIIGITHLPLFTFKKVKYFDEYISGIGFLPGTACVVSDIKFSDFKGTAYTQILKKIIVHEVGHNLGLPHCTDAKCIMSKDNGNIDVLVNSEGDYCSKCRKILQWPKKIQL